MLITTWSSTNIHSKRFFKNSFIGKLMISITRKRNCPTKSDTVPAKAQGYCEFFCKARVIT